jgi:uncharacterized protein YndB with AHSA1/START domain
MRRPCLALVVVAILGWGSAGAEVVDSAATGFLIQSTVRIDAPPSVVYEAVIHDIGRWWDPEHTFSGDARNLSLRAKPGGCFCERLPGGGGVRHLTVVFVDPGRSLRLVGGLGPLQDLGVAGSMTWKFSGKDGGTALVLTYSVGGHRPGGLVDLAAPVDSVLLQQLHRLKDYVESRGARPE